VPARRALLSSMSTVEPQPTAANALRSNVTRIPDCMIMSYFFLEKSLVLKLD
jgi:hypothetical protein